MVSGSGVEVSSRDSTETVLCQDKLQARYAVLLDFEALLQRQLDTVHTPIPHTPFLNPDLETQTKDASHNKGLWRGAGESLDSCYGQSQLLGALIYFFQREYRVFTLHSTLN